MTFLVRLVASTTAAGCLISSAIAQTASFDEGEFSAYFGPVLGSIGNHLGVGAASGVGITPYALLMLDSSYSSLGSDLLRAYQPPVVARGSRLFELSSIVHIRVPIRNRRVSPYGLLGASLLHSSFETPTAPGGSVYTRQSTDNFGLQTGGGVRYYIGESWGIRPELRYCISNQNFFRLSIGVFSYVPGVSWFRPRSLLSKLVPGRRDKSSSSLQAREGRADRIRPEHLPYN